MYCSISCSRAWRSPSSWYLRRRTLSLSGTRSPLGQPDGVAVDLYVVDSGIEHAPHTELGARVAFECVEQPPVERPDHRLERVVVHGQSNDQLVVVARRACGGIEQGVERELDV